MKEHSVNWSKVWVSTMRHGRCPNACASSSKLRIARQHFTAEANRMFGKMHLLASWRILKKLQLFWNWICENEITYIYKILTTNRSCNKSWDERAKPAISSYKVWVCDYGNNQMLLLEFGTKVLGKKILEDFIIGQNGQII